jgi:type IV pilus assembly protein PilA
MGMGRRWRLGRTAGTLRAEEGFTMVELLVVLLIIGALLAIAISSYLGYASRSADAAAKANIRATLPSIEAYYNDNATYVGMTVAGLKAGYDSGIAAGVSFFGAPTATSYCVSSTQSGHTWSVQGPAASATYKNNGTCS